MTDLLDFFGIAAGSFEQFGEFEDFAGDLFARDGDFFTVEDFFDFFTVEDDAFFACLGAPDKPEFVVKDEGIKENSFTGVVENDVLSAAGEFFVLELGGVFAFLVSQRIFKAFDGLVEGCVGLGDLGDQLRSIATFSLFTLGQSIAEFDFVIEGIGGGFFEGV